MPSMFIIEHLAQQNRIARVIFDEENIFDWFHAGTSNCRGNLILLNQKALMHRMM